MTWIVGVDEAGYGPNLGPFIMSSVACWVPEELAGESLWRMLRTAVRRSSASEDHRLVVDDSKLVYSPTRGLHALESGVAATLSAWPKTGEFTFQHLLGHVCPSHSADGKAECWFNGETLLPVEMNLVELAPSVSRFDQACERKGIGWGLFRSVIVHASKFNSILAEWKSKGAVLGHALTEILQANLTAANDSEPIWFFVDKHGGRNTYAALLQNAIPDGFVLAQEESMRRSSYHVIGMDREVRLTFEPRADSRHFCVALASMISKYLRELFMLEFNRYWQEQVPGLEATAGYPGDADRFFTAVRPALQRLCIAEETVWRKR
jgi:ribonuclease HII